MSDKDAAREIASFKADTTEAIRPHVNALMEACQGIKREAARIAGDPLTKENEQFWTIATNFFTAAHGQLDPADPAVINLVDLSKAIATASHFDDWASAYAACDRLFEQMDGGEELGLSDDFLGVDWHDETQRDVALRKGMQFHRVPRSYQRPLADAVTQLMFATRLWEMADEQQLPQPWATTTTYVVFAIAERLKGTLGRFQ
jgi:hypothetical protein